MELHAFVKKGRAARQALRKQGFVVIEKGIWDEKSLQRLEDISSLVALEKVLEGDADDKHCLFVGRLMKAPPGIAPTQVSAYTSEVITLLQQPRLMAFLQDIMETQEALNFRRGQFNILPTNAFIGPHIDRDADPDYELVLILHLSSPYKGGEYVIETPITREKVYLRPAPYSLLVSSTDVNHWVEMVTDGERKTLIMFVSRSNGINRKGMQ